MFQHREAPFHIEKYWKYSCKAIYKPPFAHNFEVEDYLNQCCYFVESHWQRILIFQATLWNHFFDISSEIKAYSEVFNKQQVNQLRLLKLFLDNYAKLVGPYSSWEFLYLFLSYDSPVAAWFVTEQ